MTSSRIPDGYMNIQYVVENYLHPTEDLLRRVAERHNDLNLYKSELDVDRFVNNFQQIKVLYHMGIDLDVALKQVAGFNYEH